LGCYLQRFFNAAVTPKDAKALKVLESVEGVEEVLNYLSKRY